MAGGVSVPQASPCIPGQHARGGKGRGKQPAAGPRALHSEPDACSPRPPRRARALALADRRERLLRPRQRRTASKLPSSRLKREKEGSSRRQKGPLAAPLSRLEAAAKRRQHVVVARAGQAARARVRWPCRPRLKTRTPWASSLSFVLLAYTRPFSQLYVRRDFPSGSAPCPRHYAASYSAASWRHVVAQRG